MNLSLSDFIAKSKARLDLVLDHYLKEIHTPAPILQQSMAYAVFNGGKRVRSLLAYATGHALSANIENTDIAACAVELIHAYSLIHDDLPAMDNADLRRGKPACHKAYNEAIAILAGDTLQTLAFQIIATHPATLQPEQRIQMIAALSEASGLAGMASGQTLDILSTNKSLSIEELLHLYQLKTGALLTASVKLGALSSNQFDKQAFVYLEKYANCLGLAFQIQDDLLDIESDTVTMGKPQGIDVINNKQTYPALVGIENTKHKIQELTEIALNSIEFLGIKGDMLRQLALHLLNRKQ